MFKGPGYVWDSKKLTDMSINKIPPLKNKIRFDNLSNQRRQIIMPLKMSVSSFMGYLKGKSLLMPL